LGERGGGPSRRPSFDTSVFACGFDETTQDERATLAVAKAMERRQDERAPLAVAKATDDRSFEGQDGGHGRANGRKENNKIGSRAHRLGKQREDNKSGS